MTFQEQIAELQNKMDAIRANAEQEAVRLIEEAKAAVSAAETKANEAETIADNANADLREAKERLAALLPPAERTRSNTQKFTPSIGEMVRQAFAAGHKD